MKGGDGQSLSTTSKDELAVICDEGDQYCYDNYFILYPQVNYSNYRIRITLDEFEGTYATLIEGLHFFMFTANERYTKFLLGLRYTLFGISIVSLIVYLVFYIKSSEGMRTFEHKYIMALSISLQFFNDPLYALTILKANAFWAVLSTLFVTSFVSLLVTFWIITFQRMYRERTELSTNLLNKRNVGLGVAIFILTSISGLIASIYSRFDPGLHANTE